MEETTTILVFKQDAERIKALHPELRNDAYRVNAILRKIINVTTLPCPADADRPLVVTIQNESEER